jgi:membrane-associated phospholipid phosphatase
MNKLKSYLYHLKAFDLIVVIFYALLTLLNIIFCFEIEVWGYLVFFNLLTVFIAFLIPFFETKYENKFWKIVHYLYIAPLILFTFKELHYLIRPIRGYDYDWLFIKIDRFIFGANPTQILYHISFPALTELLQIVYSSFYLLPLILALVLLRKRRFLACDYAVFSVIYGFYLSYVGYFMLPGIGPRFTLYNFANLNKELPGLFLTHFLRYMIDIGESIPNHAANPANYVQRDVFPSGHTMMTLIVMYLSVKLRDKSKYFFVPWGFLLIFATVYLRYHYFVDLIGGFLFMVFSVWTGKHIFNWWRKTTGHEEFTCENC